ncbi:hypothetical protein MTR67_032613 [Solanum verrucosum]|uniref:Pentatricopeptide repeat-containing protein n=1 Tax=Solanum verrucosum TaxID=315347 RepID=A0AAF0ZI59_SOLVR|nr:hypothetical protein MTR67_032613 [Solanum verrucosum]
MVKLVQQSWWKFSTCFLRVSSSYSTIAETIASLDLTNEDEQGSNPLTSSPKDALRTGFSIKSPWSGSRRAYFTSIPDDSRTYQVYGALLNCYADANVFKKAEDTMQKLKELGYAGTLAYNVMMTLYAKLGYLEKLQSLVLEMEDNGISGVPEAGDIEKANESLKKCEHRLMGKREKLGIDMLITLYTSMGHKDDVYRIWNKYKKKVKRHNSSYHCMIRGLELLDDLDGAEEIFAEWETNRVHFDIRIPNLLISVYCKKGHMDKALSIIEQLEESGKHPNGSTWNRLALGYCVQNDMDKAVDTMKKAILASQPGWKPHFHSLASCVKYLQSKGDTQGEEELKDLLRVRGLCSKKFERFR